jgi:hypothetical protein
MDSALLGVVAKHLGFSGLLSGVGGAGTNLVGYGREEGAILYDPIEVSVPLRVPIGAELEPADDVFPDGEGKDAAIGRPARRR